MKIDRLINILMMLINKKKVTANELSEYFEVSVRTVQRDIDTLCKAGIPIYAEVGKNGGYRLVDQYKMDKNFLNIDEGKVLISFLENLQESIPYTEVKSIFNKFSTIQSGTPRYEKIVVKMNAMINEHNFRETLNNIAVARDHYKKLKITYMDAEFKESSRIICPYTLVMMGATWYVYGYCTLRDDFRLFKLSRIVDCEVLKERFEMAKLPETLPWENNLDSGRKGTKVVLEIDKILQGKLPEYIDYRDCIIEEDKIIATINFPVDEWLYSFLMGLIPYVKILEPSFVREEFKKRLKLTLEKNKL